MDNKTVIIGGTSGIGLAAAQTLIAAGHEVVIAGRDQQKLEAALARLNNSGQGYTVDAASEKQLQGFYDRVGSFDHLVLSHSGGKGGGPFSSLDLTALREGFEAKFWSQVRAAQLALPHLKKNGSLTFVTAASAQMANPGTSGLAAINGALERMIPVLAVELAPIRVNGVSPGVIDTPWWNQYPPGEKASFFEHYSKLSLVGRVGQPEDIAGAIHFLVTNGYITGQTLLVHGGIR